VILRRNSRADKNVDTGLISAAKTVDHMQALNYVGRSDAPIAQLVEQLTFNQ
jgi:hypothetical protein